LEISNTDGGDVQMVEGAPAIAEIQKASTNPKWKFTSLGRTDDHASAREYVIKEMRVRPQQFFYHRQLGSRDDKLLRRALVP